MTLFYRGILVLMMIFVLRCMFHERSFWKQIADMLVLVPMVLRILMIK
ncbi:MAG: hypothetical protein SOY64_07150 [Pyramidobacter sp.]|nr:hypothetical protein [Pyramidobacter sp.]MDY4032816.1 hypothetical protein [Pyramidobacter sp.]